MAVLLRFWNLGSADYTHDELSALYRTQFDSLGDLIDQAIRVDGHPALTQLILYYWAPWVDYQEFWVKLLPVVFGLATLIVVYLSADLLDPKGPLAFLAPAVVAGSELFVYHHQVARPYALGGFFVSLAAYAYLRWFYQSKQKSALLLFIIGATLAAYTHYLALLSVLLIGISALIRDRQNRRAWVISGLIVLLLFSPHLGIFWDQWQLGGVGQWLGPPQIDWLGKFFAHLLNSPALPAWAGLLLMAALALVAFRFRFRDTWFWFLACFLIAFAYSLWRNPVLQYSSLLFLSPFIFLLPGSAVSNKRNVYAWLAPFALLLYLTLNLIYQRSYYQEAQKSPPKEVARYLAGQQDQAVFYHWSEEKWRFYQKIDSSIPSATAIEELAASKLPHQGFLLVMDHQSPVHWPVQLQDLGFPLRNHQHHFGFSWYHFGARTSQAIKPERVTSLIDRAEIPVTDDQYNSIGSLSTDRYLGKMDQSAVVVQFENLTVTGKAHLVFQIEEAGQQVAWFAHPLSSGKQYISRPVSHYPLDRYHWKVLIDKGSDKTPVRGSLSVRLAPGNQKLYGQVSAY